MAVKHRETKRGAGIAADRNVRAPGSVGLGMSELLPQREKTPGT
jgi:hypothetical protein